MSEVNVRSHRVGRRDGTPDRYSVGSIRCKHLLWMHYIASYYFPTVLIMLVRVSQVALAP